MKLCSTYIETDKFNEGVHDIVNILKYFLVLKIYFL